MVNSMSRDVGELIDQVNSMSDRGELDGEFAGCIESTALLQTAMDRLEHGGDWAPLEPRPRWSWEERDS